MIALTSFGYLVVALGAGVGVVLLRALLMAWRARRDSELVGSVFDLLALAARRGQPLVPVLERAAGEQRGRARRWLAGRVAWLLAGHRLSEALAHGPEPRLPDAALAAISAAEGGPALPAVLDDVARGESYSRSLRYRFALAVGYPMLLALVLCMVCATTQSLLIRGAAVAVWNGPRLLPWAIALLGALVLVWAGASLPWRRGGPAATVGLVVARLLPWPGRLLARLSAAKALRCCGTQVAAGVPLPAALRTAAAASDARRLRRGLARAADAVERGEPLGLALRSSGLPRSAVARLGTARTPEQLVSSCATLAEDCRQWAGRSVERARRTLLPLGLLLVALLLALQFGELMSWLEVARDRAIGGMPW